MLKNFHILFSHKIKLFNKSNRQIFLTKRKFSNFEVNDKYNSFKMNAEERQEYTNYQVCYLKHTRDHRANLLFLNRNLWINSMNCKHILRLNKYHLNW